MDPKSRTLAN
jgi:ribosome biogenesis protein BMS1